MAKLPNRLVIEIAKIDKVDELGNPVIGFESKDYDECIIEELEKIKAEIDVMYDSNQYSDEFEHGIMRVREIINNRIAELKGDKCDNDHDCEHCDWVECPELKGDTE